MRNEDVVNLRELRERQVADPGAGVDQDVAIEEKRRCAQVAPSDPPRAAEHAQTHAPNPSTFRRMPSRRSMPAAAGAGASPRAGRGRRRTVLARGPCYAARAGSSRLRSSVGRDSDSLLLPLDPDALDFPEYHIFAPVARHLAH